MEVAKDIELKRNFWMSLDEWIKKEHEWKHAPFDTIDSEELNKQVQHFAKVVFLSERGLPDNPVIPRFKKMVNLIDLLSN